MTWIPSAKRMLSSNFRLILAGPMLRHVNDDIVTVLVVLREARKAISNLLVLLPMESASLHGEPVEEILLSRDQIANAAWGLEQLAPGPFGRPLDRHEIWQHSRPVPEPAPGIPHEAALSYQLATALPPYWPPLLNEPAPGGTNRSTQIRLAAIAAPLGTLVYPGFTLHEESLTRTGVAAPAPQKNPISRRPAPHLDRKAKIARHRRVDQRPPLRQPAQRLTRRVAPAE